MHPVYINVSLEDLESNIVNSNIVNSDIVNYNIVNSDNVNYNNVNYDNVNYDNVNSDNVNYDNVNSDNVNSDNVNLELNILELNSENVNSENVNSDNVDLELNILELNSENIKKSGYQNDKLIYVKDTIEECIEQRNNYTPNFCIIYFQPIIVMFLDFVTYIYVIWESFLLWLSSIIVIIDLFNITKRVIKIKGRSPIYNKFSIEDAPNERERRIIYWMFWNYDTPDEDDWKATLKRFNLLKIPKFTIRLWSKNIITNKSITIDEIIFADAIDDIIIKGSRTLSYYSDDIVNTTIEKNLIKSITGKIPVGGLLPEQFIQDVGGNKKTN